MLRLLGGVRGAGASSISVGVVPMSTTAPHDEQKRLESGIWLEQDEQRMVGAGFYHYRTPRGLRLTSGGRPGRWSVRAAHFDGGAVGQYFGDALHHLVGIVADGDHGVGAGFRGVLQHQVEGL